ncbi:alanine-zipper protein [Streptomyces sp. NPDC003077]|uniref:alanine-zipper protein n=1 Tax=Streptomyces sp. NPDC003077 TaxID=3154443 RepID=UPI00339F91EC
MLAGRAPSFPGGYRERRGPFRTRWGRSVQSRAHSVQSRAHSVQSRARSAQSRARSAQSRARSAHSGALSVQEGGRSVQKGNALLRTGAALLVQRTRNDPRKCGGGVRHPGRLGSLSGSSGDLSGIHRPERRFPARCVGVMVRCALCECW